MKTEGLERVLSFLLSSSSLLPDLAGKLFGLFPSEDLHVCYRTIEQTGNLWISSFFHLVGIATSLSSDSGGARELVDKRKASSDITIRSIAIGLLLMPGFVYLVALQEMIWHALHWSSMSLPQISVFVVAVLVFINFVLKRFSPRIGLSQNEILIIYIMLCTTLAFTAHDNMVCLMGVLAHGFWYATPENDWANLFHNHLPGWLVVDNAQAARDFYRGESILVEIRAQKTPDEVFEAVLKEVTSKA